MLENHVVSFRRSPSILAPAWRKRGKSAVYGNHRQAVPRNALVWRAADGPPYARKGHKCGRHPVRRLMRPMRLVPICQEPKTSKKHPDHKIHPVSSQGPGDHPPQSGLMYRHHVYPHAPRVPVPGRRHGLAQPEGAELAAANFHGRWGLHLGFEGGAGQIRPAGDLQLPLSRHFLRKYPAGQWIRARNIPAPISPMCCAAPR